jgi:hypothetical protein
MGGGVESRWSSSVSSICRLGNIASAMAASAEGSETKQMMQRESMTGRRQKLMLEGKAVMMNDTA